MEANYVLSTLLLCDPRGLKMYHTYLRPATCAECSRPGSQARPVVLGLCRKVGRSHHPWELNPLKAILCL